MPHTRNQKVDEKCKSRTKKDQNNIVQVPVLNYAQIKDCTQWQMCNSSQRVTQQGGHGIKRLLLQFLDLPEGGLLPPPFLEDRGARK